MINRRLIRIKVFQALFGEFGQENTRPSVTLSNIKKSILGVENNFLSVLNFGPELSHFINSEHNPSELKYQPTSDDIKSYKLITNNSFIKKVAALNEIEEFAKRPSFDWQQEKEVVFLIYKELKKSDAFKIAMSKELNEENDFEFAKFIYKHLLLDSVEFEQLMEHKNIFWYDEKIPILKSLEKVFKSYEEQGQIQFPEASKNTEEDLQMAEEILNNYLEHRTDIQECINVYTPG
ncbi:MAG: hypothetical protein KJP21_05385, partial [Bacteroidia bacterium]|nr:hypothetical protein [Bacteroidia bacterium]NNJ56208.1 hypothetical protein [Bacteroidia bacterium]